MTPGLTVEFVSVIAVDPGLITGMCFLDYFCVNGVWEKPQATLLQADGQSADAVLEAMLARWYGLQNETITTRYASVEKFVTGRGAGSKGKTADITRQAVMEATERLQLHGYSVKVRSAAEVKPWATDKRLAAAGIVGDSAIHGKARDAYDAARHALFAAVRDAKMRDPLA